MNGVLLRAALATVLVLAVASGALATTAGPPGQWTRVTDANGRNIDEVGVARTANGVLHVVWKQRKGGLNEGIVHTPITAAGKVGATTPVVVGLKSVGNPDVVRLPDGKLRTFFPGLGGTNADGGIKAATAPGSGVGWTREGVRVSSSVSAIDSVGAAVAKGGDTVFGYALSFHLAVHVGLDPTAADKELQPDKKCCDYLPALATDAAGGQTFAAWFSNASGRTGIWAQQVLPSVGPRLLAPGSAQGGKAVSIDQRAAIRARTGGPGVYVAYCRGYPTCTRALLWRVGGGTLVAGTGADVEDVNLAAGPEGRLWVMWHEGRTNLLLARRTNKAVTRIGPLLKVKPPAGTSTVWKLKGEGTPGPLDLLASVSSGGSLATWHTQVLPPLALSAKKGASTVTFAVTDVGDAVPGAKVSYAGKTLTTNAQGHATAALAKGSLKAIASRAGYTGAAVTVTG